MTQQSATFLPSIDKLLGRENYTTWSFAVKTYLQHESLWEYVDPDAPAKPINEKQMSLVIKMSSSDHGGEYISSELQEYLRKNGIIHQTSAPYTPEQNGLAERMNRTIVERARSALIAAGLPKMFWAEAVSTVAYLINRSPTRGHGRTPEEIWSGQKPDLSHLKVFGCKALVHIPKKFRRKFDPKSTEMIFVGYCENTKGYRLIHPVTRRLTISRDVVFIENEFVRNVRSTVELHESVGEVFPLFENDLDSDVNNSNQNDTANEHNPLQNVTANELDSEFIGQYQCDDAPSGTTESVPTNSDHELTSPSNTISLPNVRRSERVPKPRIFPDFVTYCVNGFIPDDPSTVEEALGSGNSEVWKRAMIEEFNSLQENNTWKLTELPPNRKPIQCKWVFKTKRDADGRIVRYKARLVAKGFTQKQGIDYGETFSPVVRYTSIRMLLAISAKYNLDIEQMDVVTAFLHGKIDEDIYMIQPPEFAQDDKVCKLNKALYGLKQSSRQWFMSQGGAISWSSRRQPTIALSTTEAEYMALSSAVQESSWLSQFEKQFNFGGQRNPIQIFCDNTSALDLATTTGYSARTKHIDVRHHFLREHIESGRINLVHISTDEMLADVLTKPLNSKKHLFCSEGMGLKF